MHPNVTGRSTLLKETVTTVGEMGHTARNFTQGSDEAQKCGGQGTTPRPYNVLNVRGGARFCLPMSVECWHREACVNTSYYRPRCASELRQGDSTLVDGSLSNVPCTWLFDTGADVCVPNCQTSRVGCPLNDTYGG